MAGGFDWDKDSVPVHAGGASGFDWNKDSVPHPSTVRTPADKKAAADIDKMLRDEYVNKKPPAEPVVAAPVEAPPAAPAEPAPVAGPIQSFRDFLGKYIPEGPEPTPEMRAGQKQFDAVLAPNSWKRLAEQPGQSAKAGLQGLGDTLSMGLMTPGIGLVSPASGKRLERLRDENPLPYQIGGVASLGAPAVLGAPGRALRNGASAKIETLLEPARAAIDAKNTNLTNRYETGVNRVEDMLSDLDVKQANKARQDVITSMRARGESQDKIAAALAKLDAEEAGLAATEKGKLGQAYQSDYQAEHVYDVPDEKLSPEARARRDLLRGKKADVAERRLTEPLPEERVAAEMQALRESIAKRREALLNPETRAAASGGSTLDPEVLKRLTQQRLAEGQQTGEFLKSGAETKPDPRLNPKWLRENGMARQARALEAVPEPVPMPKDAELARGLSRQSDSGTLAKLVGALTGESALAPRSQYVMARGAQMAGKGLQMGGAVPALAAASARARGEEPGADFVEWLKKRVGGL